MAKEKDYSVYKEAWDSLLGLINKCSAADSRCVGTNKRTSVGEQFGAIKGYIVNNAGVPWFIVAEDARKEAIMARKNATENEQRAWARHNKEISKYRQINIDLRACIDRMINRQLNLN